MGLTNCSFSFFLQQLISRFYLVAPDNATAEQKSYFDQWAKVIQVRTIGVVKKWIDNYYVDFDSDPDAYQGLVDFLEMAEEVTFFFLPRPFFLKKNKINKIKK